MGVGVVLDNGGGYIKAGWVPLDGNATNASEPLSVPNALAKAGKAAVAIPADVFGTSKRPSGLLVGAEIERAPEFSGMTLRRPVERGVVTLWDVQRDVWASVFSSDRGIGLPDPSDATLLVTEPLGVPLHMRAAMDELVFEEFGFAAYSAVPPQRLAAAAAHRKTALVLDSGFSFTHAVPVVDGRELASCARRLNLGGKALTNHLKETVSFRSWNMMDETPVINAIKERLCYVSLSYASELASTKRKNNAVRREYILPDLSRAGVDRMGHVRMPEEEMDGTEQILVMNNERICVPEILFNPSDVGMPQAGIAETIFQAVEAAPVQHRPELYSNIVLTGGNCSFRNFRNRVIDELRPLVSANYDVHVWSDDENPMLTTFRGGIRAFTEPGSVPFNTVTRDVYNEHGSRGVLDRFYPKRPSPSES